jgi:murein DD-endopeptidase MepM/ murein hydrolase activator NlpD
MEEPVVMAEEARSVLPSEQTLILLPESLRPGEPLTAVWFVPQDIAVPEEMRAVLLDSEGRTLNRANFFFLQAVGAEDLRGASPDVQRASGAGGETPARIYAAFLALPSTAKAGTALLRVNAGGVQLWEAAIPVLDRDFVSEEIALTPSLSAIRTEEDPQKTRESRELWAILGHTGTAIYTLGSFSAPVNSTRRTSFYGDRRVYRYSNGRSDTAIHAGVDYGVGRGAEIRACAPGLVVLSRSRISTGNSVIIEHLPGVYSLYYHLDRLDIGAGEIVEEGRILGLSGSTGLATGPHLHWEIRVAGENTDPDALIAHPLLDKDAILGILLTGND